MPSLAQSPMGDPDAFRLKRQGDDAMESGRHAEALNAYSEALTIEPSPALHCDRGRALQALGRNAEALDELERCERTASTKFRAAIPELADTIALVRRQVAMVTVNCDVPRAILHVRGKTLTLPLREPLLFDPATFDFEVVATGYQPWRTRLTLKGGEQHELAARLKRQNPHGTLIVTSPVSGARAGVDGKPVGTVPLEIELDPGEHTITLQHQDYQTASSRFVLRSGERRSLSITMQQSPRWYQRWWFWTGIGTAVAAGLVIGIAVSAGRSPAKGDPPAGQATSTLLTQ